MYIQILNLSKDTKEDFRIDLKYSLNVLNSLIKYKNSLKSINLDLFNKESISLIFEDSRQDLIIIKFYKLTKNTYNTLDTQIIKLFFN